jgi:Tol biopolymer transport system component
VFAPSGDAIFYVSSPENSPNTDEHFEIFRLNLNELVEERLTFNNRADHHPYPSEDGTKIIFETLTEPDYLALGKWAIHELELASSTEHIILDDDNINLFPRYSVDGNRVYFSCLNIESFGMKIASYNLITKEKTYLVDEYYNALNVDPF